jgi:hypothetical protein
MLTVPALTASGPAANVGAETTRTGGAELGDRLRAGVHRAADREALLVAGVTVNHGGAQQVQRGRGSCGCLIRLRIAAVPVENA